MSNISQHVNLDLLVIESLDLPSGFHGVYPKGTSWCAKPWKSYHLGSTFRTPRQAALAVVGWWKRHFGAQWKEAYALRRERPWSIVKYCCDPGWLMWSNDGRLTSGAHGYRLFVWELGRKLCVPPPDTESVLYADRQSAKDYLDRWARNRYGLFADVVITPFPCVMHY